MLVNGVSVGFATDWTSYRFNNTRSGVTPAEPVLGPATPWIHKSSWLPQPSWEKDGKWDAYSKRVGLQPQRDFDKCFYTIAIGDDIYYGSTVDNGLHCLDAWTGEEKWVFFSDGAIRIAPTYNNGSLLIGSDDGFVYSVNSKNGTLNWKYTPTPGAQQIASNGKLMSQHPCRTGVMVEEGVAYCSFSLVPWSKSYFCALDASTGRCVYRKEYLNMSLQSAMLSNGESIYVLQGKSSPVVFNPSSGKAKRPLIGTSGTFAAFGPNNTFICMPSVQRPSYRLSVMSPNSKDAISSFVGGRIVLFDDTGDCYFYKNGSLLSLDFTSRTMIDKKIRDLNRKYKIGSKKAPKLTTSQKDEYESIKSSLDKNKEKTERWSMTMEKPVAMIKAGGLLILGLQDKVVAIDVMSREMVWNAKVDGAALGLTATQNGLYVSTDLGKIIGFPSIGKVRGK